MGRSFVLTVRYFLLTVFVAYGKLGLVFSTRGCKIWFGLVCLWWKIGLVFFLLSVPPRPQIGFGLFCLRFPPP